MSTLRLTNPMPQQAEGFVYVIEASCGVKIGWSRYPFSRFDAISRELGEEVHVWSCRPGTRADEGVAHHRWAHLSVEGEWFKPTNELLAWAESEGAA